MSATKRQMKPTFELDLFHVLVQPFPVHVETSSVDQYSVAHGLDCLGVTEHE